VLDEAALGDLLDTAVRDLFRLETLDLYEVRSDGSDFDRYLRGEPGPDMARKQPWMDRLAADAARGLRNYRVHVLRSPLSPYVRYECEWGYAFNVTAGEEIRVLDLAERPEPAGLVHEDFWLMDDTTVVRMRYREGRFTGAEVLPPADLDRYRAARDAAWHGAVPFTEYWSAHRHYWRDRQASVGRP
jgi:hypothetical protein